MTIYEWICRPIFMSCNMYVGVMNAYVYSLQMKVVLWLFSWVSNLLEICGVKFIEEWPGVSSAAQKLISELEFWSPKEVSPSPTQ